MEAHAKPVEVERGTLREIRPGDDMDSLRRQLPDKAHCFGQLWWWAKHKGYKPGFAAVKVKEIFGSFPRAREPEPETISHPVMELMTYLMIATDKWKKEQRRRQRAQPVNEAERDLKEFG